MRSTNVRNPKHNPDSGKPFDYAEIFRVLYEKAWLIALCLVVAAFIVAGVIMKSTPLYESRVVVQVEQSESKVLENVQEINPQNLQMADLLTTIMENLKSADVLLRVVRTAELGKDMTFPEPRDHIMTEAELVGALKNNMDISLRKGTRLIDVAVEDEIPERAQKLATILINEYVGQSIQSRAEAANSANQFLATELKRLADELSASELALQQYKDERQAVSLEEKQNIVTEKLKDLNMRLTQAKSERIRLENDRGQVELFKGNPEKLLSIPSVANQRSIGDIRGQVSMAAAEVANISQRYRPKHPRYIQTMDRYKDLERSLNQIIITASEGIGNAYQSAISTEKKVEEALREQEKAALDLEKISIEYNALSREVEANRALYASVQKRMKETDITRGIEATPLRVVESPVVPEHPSKPKKFRMWLIGLGLGLVVGLGLAFSLHSFDDTLRTVDDAESDTGLQVIAAMPTTSKFKTLGESLVMIKSPDSVIAESFRILRSSLELMDHSNVEDKHDVVLFTSSVPSEGKSFCSANFAIASAQLGKRTLLIDADLRRPMVDEIFFKGRKSIGLADIIQGKVTLEEALHVSSTQNLFILSAGTQTRMPAELLASPALGKFLVSLKDKFDRIVLDTAPVHAVGDTLHLVKHCDHVCLVAKAAKTPGKVVQRAAQLLEEAGKAPSGLVLNMLPKRSNKGYYYSYYSGSYGKPVYGGTAAS